MDLPNGYRLSLVSSELQLDAIHAYLTRSYWSPGIPKTVVAKAIAHSLCVGVYAPDGAQVGFARIATDHATFGYLADVFVLEGHRGKGLSRAMVAALLALPEVRGLRRIMLVTRDAQGLYAKLGFEPVVDPKPLMQILRKGVYQGGGIE
ncbi:MAG TPA: GNAT family N-acetyltransferase [Holophagaceae bacterium]|jgi:GNAT superfamily N-acetyltransferase|nr:GNAT family N-acetyltransferase [Holophagaceae bacterium]